MKVNPSPHPKYYCILTFNFDNALEYLKEKYQQYICHFLHIHNCLLPKSLNQINITYSFSLSSPVQLFVFCYLEPTVDVIASIYYTPIGKISDRIITYPKN